MTTFNWTCPHCNRDTTITDVNHIVGLTELYKSNVEGPRELGWEFIACPNSKCRKFTLAVVLKEVKYQQVPGTGSSVRQTRDLKRYSLVPQSEAKVFPDYIPTPVCDDYLEACLIRNLSPKASATLSRRCLQGMIRNFWQIKKNRLIDEINELEHKVDPLTWKAIDAVRSIGNVGAHMERDINIIIDVDPDEAAQLIGLIELLVRDWYVTRYEREERLKSIAAMAQAKKNLTTKP